MTTPELTVESCLAELREMFPEPQICVGIRDCGEETITPRGTLIEYDAQVGANGKDFTADSLPELIAQVRAWRREQDRQQQHEDSYFDDPLRGTNKC